MFVCAADSLKKLMKENVASLECTVKSMTKKLAELDPEPVKAAEEAKKA